MNGVKATSRDVSPKGGFKSKLNGPSTLAPPTRLKATGSANRLNGATTNGAPRPGSSRPVRTGLPAGPKSTEKDEVDDIYKEKDPIDVTMAKRKKQPKIVDAIRGENSK